MSNLVQSMSQNAQLNFLLTNRIPRRLATQFMGWLSGIENPRSHEQAGRCAKCGFKNICDQKLV